MDIYGMDLRGKFWPQRLATIDEDPWEADDEGRVLYDETLQSIFYGSATEWVKINSATNLLNLNQRLVFASVPLPTGWNIDEDVNDRMIMVTSTTGQIGSTGGDWTITGVQNSGGHNHNTNTLTPSIILGRGTSEIYANVGGPTHTHVISTDGIHSHTFDGSWRPRRISFVIGEYTG